ncbi:MAG: hypothetical protein AAF288_13875 [Planctomycetota bacterium]
MTRNLLTLVLTAAAINTACASQPESPQLDLWYDLGMVTDHSATYGTVGSFRGDFHLVVEPDEESAHANSRSHRAIRAVFGKTPTT